MNLKRLRWRLLRPLNRPESKIVSVLPPWFSRYSAVFAGLFCSLTLPSSSIVQKYTGNIGLLLYLTLVAIALALFLSHYRKIYSLVPERRFGWMAAATIVGILLLFAVVYPTANVQIPGKGSDGDDAIHLGAIALLRGESPYNQITYLGNPTVNLPGALLLALPFAALGSAALQNVFWLSMLLITFCVYLQDRRAALLAVWMILILSPTVVHALVIGTDQLANSIYVMLAIIGLVTVAQQPERSTIAVLGMAAVVGVALTSRANFMFLTPLIFTALAANRGWRVAALAMAVMVVTIIGLIAPFYLTDPDGFTPLRTAKKLRQLEYYLPHAMAWIIGLNLLLAVILAFRKANARLSHLLAHCACVLALPVAAGALLPSLHTQQLVLNLAGYGKFFLFFGVTASWAIFTERAMAKSAMGR